MGVIVRMLAAGERLAFGRQWDCWLAANLSHVRRALGFAIIMNPVQIRRTKFRV